MPERLMADRATDPWRSDNGVFARVDAFRTEQANRCSNQGLQFLIAEGYGVHAQRRMLGDAVVAHNTSTSDDYRKTNPAALDVLSHVCRSIMEYAGLIDLDISGLGVHNTWI